MAWSFQMNLLSRPAGDELALKRKVKVIVPNASKKRFSLVYDILNWIHLTGQVMWKKRKVDSNFVSCNLTHTSLAVCLLLWNVLIIEVASLGYSFTFNFIRQWNIVPRPKERTQMKGVTNHLYQLLTNVISVPCDGSLTHVNRRYVRLISEAHECSIGDHMVIMWSKNIQAVSWYFLVLLWQRLLRRSFIFHKTQVTNISETLHSV